MTNEVVDVMAIGRSHGIAGFEREHEPSGTTTHAVGDFALATRLGLPGFESADDPVAGKPTAGVAR